MTSYTTVGKAVTRLEGPQKVTGGALYPADVHVPGMLWGKALRSPLPHARILNVDTSRASRLPGVHAVLTGTDLSGIHIGRRMLDLPVLAWDKVRFIGQKVAAVAAEDQDIAEDALELIDVEYEELPAVFDPLEAMRPGAPILHENINSYKGLPEPVQEPTNRFVHNEWDKGDIERGFAEADMLFEHSFTPASRAPGIPGAARLPCAGGRLGAVSRCGSTARSLFPCVARSPLPSVWSPIGCGST